MRVSVRVSTRVSDNESEQQSEQENVQSPTLGGITQGLCQLPASVPLGSKLQHLQRDGHAGRRNDNICSISVFCHTRVEAECKLRLQQRQVLWEVAISFTEAGMKEEESEQERPHGGRERSCSSEGRDAG